MLIGYARVSTLDQNPELQNGRIGDRPPLMTVDKIRTALAMLKDAENHPFISEIIKTLAIGRTTFYRHFPPEKIEQFRSQQ